MAKIQNKLKPRKITSTDKVAKRKLKAQKAFDEAAEQKRREDDERHAPPSASDQMP